MIKKTSVWPLRNVIMLTRKFAEANKLKAGGQLTIAINGNVEVYYIFPTFSKETILVSHPVFERSKNGLITKRKKPLGVVKIEYYNRLGSLFKVPASECILTPAFSKKIGVKHGDAISLSVNNTSLDFLVNTNWFSNARYGDELKELFPEDGIFITSENWKTHFVPAHIGPGDNVEFVARSKEVDEYYRAAKDLLRRSKYEEALKLYGKALALDPGDVRVLVDKGAALVNLERYGEANECYDSALKIAPNLEDALLNKGTTLSKMGKDEEALIYLDKVLAKHKNATIALLAKAIALYNLDRKKEADSLFDRVLSLRADTFEAWYYKGLINFDFGKEREALRIFEHVLTLRPELALAWNAKGKVLMRMDRQSNALNCFDKALKINPQYEEAWVNKGALYYKQGKYDDAVSCYNKALEISPESIEAWYNKGSCFWKLGKLEEALSCYERVLHLYPGFIQAIYSRAEILFQLNGVEDAVASITKSIEQNPASAGELAVLLEKVDPDAQEPENRLLLIGIVLYKLGRYDRAIKYFDKILSRNPNNAEAWFNKGLSLHKLGKLTEAIVCYNKTLEIDQTHGLAVHKRVAAIVRLSKELPQLPFCLTCLAFREKNGKNCPICHNALRVL